MRKPGIRPASQQSLQMSFHSTPSVGERLRPTVSVAYLRSLSSISFPFQFQHTHYDPIRMMKIRLSIGA